MEGLVSLLGARAESPELEQCFARSVSEWGEVINLYRKLGHSPAALELWMNFAYGLRHGLSLSPKIREIAITKVAIDSHSEYEFEAHSKLAMRHGVTNAELQEMTMGAIPSTFTPTERCAVEVAQSMSSNRGVSEELRNLVSQCLTESEIVELSLNIGFYVGVSRILSILGVPPEPTG